MWCTNVLEVCGNAVALDDFRLHNSKFEEKHGKLTEIPLYFGKMLARPAALDIEESSVGLRGYQALYGDWEKLLTYSWIREAGARDRASLIRVLEQFDPKHFYLAQAYRLNECRYGFRNWYTWNIEHYGTKWDLDTSTLVEDAVPGVLRYQFRTYENPPIPWLELARGAYSKLVLKLETRKPWQIVAAATLS